MLDIDDEDEILEISFKQSNSSSPILLSILYKHS